MPPKTAACEHRDGGKENPATGAGSNAGSLGAGDPASMNQRPTARNVPS
jgi:hypothetical protein